MVKEKKYQTETVTIEKIVAGGYGFAHSQEGKVLLIKGSMPGEELTVQFLENSKDFAYGRILSIEKASTHRKEPICPLFGICGGCQFLMSDYDYQLVMKQGMIEDAFEHTGNMNVRIQDWIRSPKELHYRNKASFQLFGKGKLGFCKIGTSIPIEVPKCFLMEEPIQKQVEKYRAQGENSVLTRNPRWKSWVVRTNTQGEVIDSLSKGVLVEKIGHIESLYNIHSFFQVNSLMIPLWLEKIASLIQGYSPQKPKTLLDLYCGVGLIGQYLARDFEQVLGVEINSALTDLGKKMKERNQLHNYDIVEEDAKDFLERTRLHPDVVIVNPPRNGLDSQALNLLGKMQSPCILYSSCHPVTLARDARILVEEYGYEMQELIPVDMFPQTQHVEILTTFLKK